MRIHTVFARRSLFAAVAVATLASGPAAADDGSLVDELARHEADRELRVFTVTRARVSYPQRVSGGYGAIFVQHPKGSDCRTVCDLEGWMVQVEPGVSGGQLAAGYALVLGETRNHRRWVETVYMGFGFKAAVMRTWGDAPLDARDRTLLGAEAEFTITRLNFSLGLFRPVSRGADEEWLITGGVGWGF